MAHPLRAASRSGPPSIHWWRFAAVTAHLLPRVMSPPRHVSWRSPAARAAGLRCPRRRYFAVADPAVDRVILRDVDSYAADSSRLGLGYCEVLSGTLGYCEVLSGTLGTVRCSRVLHGMLRCSRVLPDTLETVRITTARVHLLRYVGQREADAVAEWVASGQPLHFMHDHAATMELQVSARCSEPIAWRSNWQSCSEPAKPSPT